MRVIEDWYDEIVDAMRKRVVELVDGKKVRDEDRGQYDANRTPARGVFGQGVR